jgi:hypothetical protein
MNVLERLMRHVAVDEVTGCMVWTGCKDRDGYAITRYAGRRWTVHRLMWTLFRGDIPGRLVVDHQCCNRSCVNVEHLKPMTIGENVLRSEESIAGRNLRKTQCKYGHPFDAENTYLYKGKRWCRKCMATRNAAWAKRKRGETAR